MTENTETTDPTAEEKAAAAAAAKAEVAELVDALLKMNSGRPVNTVMVALTSVLLGLCSPAGGDAHQRRARAAFIIHRALQAADAAEMTPEELILTVMQSIDVKVAAEGIDPEVSAGAAALLAATAGETAQ